MEKTKKDLGEIATAFPESAPKKIAVGIQGGELEKDLQACPIGKHVFSDPDGILLDIWNNLTIRRVGAGLKPAPTVIVSIH